MILNISTIPVASKPAAKKTKPASRKRNASKPAMRRKKLKPAPVMPVCTSPRLEQNGLEEEEKQVVKRSAVSKTFKQLGLSDQLVAHVETGLGFEMPTAVQVDVVPQVLSGRDLLVKSETGSGKTLAFLLPIVQVLHAINPRPSRGSGICAIILSPTRELCLQIYTVLEKVLKRFHWIIAGALMGGEKRKSEKARLRKGLHIMVATPGRFIDHLSKTESLLASITKGNLRFFVLDEADRLLDSGFSKQVEEAVDTIKDALNEANVTRRPQNVFLSATLSPSISALAQRVLKDPLLVDMNEDGAHRNDGKSAAELAQVPTSLVQHCMVTHRKERLTTLCAFILRQVHRSRRNSKMMLFVSCRAQVDYLHSLLTSISWPPQGKQGEAATAALGTKFWKLHGSIGQNERRQTVVEFSKSKGGVLICTDVAARGLDLPSVDWIIQYDPPSEVEDYVHRIGRTARSGKRGSAVLFLCEDEIAYLELLKGYGLSLHALDKEKVIESLVCSSQGSRRPLKAREKRSLARRAQSDPHAAVDFLQIKLEDIVNKEVDSAKQDKRKRHGPEREKKRGKQATSAREDTVSLKQLAEDAYVAFIRAYAVHSKESKSIFHPKNLHLGHVARSFGLRAQPKGKSSMLLKADVDHFFRLSSIDNIDCSCQGLLKVAPIDSKRSVNVALFIGQETTSRRKLSGQPNIWGHESLHEMLQETLGVAVLSKPSKKRSPVVVI